VKTRERALRLSMSTLVALQLASFGACSSEPPAPATKAPPPAHCRNLKPDPGESGVDCGGEECDRCAIGETCVVARDCRDGQCVNGFCQHPHCGNQLRDAEEADVDCGGLLCLPCRDGSACGVASDCESKVCDAATCASASCRDGVQNGAEIDVDCGSAACPGCAGGVGCASDDECASGHCDGARCASNCESERADCDGDYSNGCETDSATDPDHCGRCDQQCGFANAGARCEGGTCKLGDCEPPFADCNLDPSDGCEVDLDRDPDNCSGCGLPCSLVHAMAACRDGACALTCDQGFDDCDHDADTGCEVSLGTDVENCGRCGTSCEHAPDAAPTCRDGTCASKP
jgi:hypothetical protein